MQSPAWESLRRWFLAARRSFPWREEATPYRVWVSEVMLQQTRADVVVPYFLKWLERFPDLQSLAEAPWEEVLKYWEGLGYYSRAQRLHQAAKMVVERWGGELPAEAEALSLLPGLGPYTVEAIRAFAFHQRAAPVDGNVLRVWSRLLSRPDPIDRPATQKRARSWLQSSLSDDRPHQLAEALIELGATVCTPQSPRCAQCPLQSVCRAVQTPDPTQFPRKTTRKPSKKITRHALLWVGPSGLLLERGSSEKRVLGHLWRLPTFESAEELLRFHHAHHAPSHSRTGDPKTCARILLRQSGGSESAQLPAAVDRTGEEREWEEQLPVCHLGGQVRHSYVHTICTLIPWVAMSAKVLPLEAATWNSDDHAAAESSRDEVDYLWVPLSQLSSLSFPSGYRSLVQLLVQHGPLLTDPHSHNRALASSTAKAVHAG